MVDRPVEEMGVEELRAEVRRLRVALAGQETALTFETTCTGCGSSLAAALDERERADDLEAMLRRLQQASIWISPGVLHGVPCIGSRRIPVSTVLEWVWHGEDLTLLLSGHHLTRHQVLVACWYAGRYGTRRWRQRWRDWADEAEDALWAMKPDAVPNPPNTRNAPTA